MFTIAIDTETTGIDFYHGSKPFLVSICFPDGSNMCWQWDVDMKTHQVNYVASELDEIRELIEAADEVVMHNAKFDIKALELAGLSWKDKWWNKTYDTMIASHLVYSLGSHDLYSVFSRYEHLNSLYEPEDNLRNAVQEALRYANNKPWFKPLNYPSARAKRGEKWKHYLWLPRAIARRELRPMQHPWRSVCSTYANRDSALTYICWLKLKPIILKRRQWDLFISRMKLIPNLIEMEDRGLSVSRAKIYEVKAKFAEKVEQAKSTCLMIGEKYGEKITMPKGSVNNSLKKFCFEKLKLPVIKETDKGSPSFDAETLAQWLHICDGDAKTFVENLISMRKHQVGVSYLDGYLDYMIMEGDYGVLHPKVNPTGTKTLRMSSSNPNEQNISKKEETNLRCCFTPRPDREFWSVDAKNIELRIPAYVAEEKEMIELFEKPDTPPFYGSNHMLIFSILWPKLWQEAVKEVGLEKAAEYCKKKYKSTQYQWVKNGNFAVQYGAIERPGGTADRAYRIDGAHAIVKQRFSNTEKLNQRLIQEANQNGYVVTLDTREQVDGICGGYRLYCNRSEWGSIIPTTPLNYFTQGTAAQWMNWAIIRIGRYFRRLRQQGYSAYIIAMIHDELVFDVPKGKERAIPVMKNVKRIMESCGDLIGIPTPVSFEYHPENYEQGIPVTI